MTAQYGRYAPMTPRSQSQNRNSAISSPRTMTPAGTNTGLTAPGTSSVRASMNVSTPTAPGGHRQTPFGGRTSAVNPVNSPGAGSVNPNATPQYSRTPTGPTGPTESPYQAQLANMNRIRTQGVYGRPIPKGNPQGAKPVSVYSRPAGAMRY